MSTPTVHVIAPDPLDRERMVAIFARSSEGLDAAEITVRFDKAAGPAAALGLLARVALEVVVRARESRPVECEAEK